jgi:exodeoxyribonuclease VII small subunit
MNTDKPIEEMSFEEALQALETIVREMESQPLPLESALAYYERGMRLARRCEVLLDQAELRVTELRLNMEQDSRVEEP